MGSRTERCEWCQDIRVNLPRVCLRGDGVSIFESGKFSDERIELLDLSDVNWNCEF